MIICFWSPPPPSRAFQNIDPENTKIPKFPNVILCFVIDMCTIFAKIKDRTWELKKLGTQTFQQIHNFRLSDMKNIFQGCPIMFLYFWSIFGDTYGVRGSTFARFVGRFKNAKNLLQYVRESKLAILE